MQGIGKNKFHDLLDCLRNRNFMLNYNFAFQDHPSNTTHVESTVERLSIIKQFKAKLATGIFTD